MAEGACEIWKNPVKAKHRKFLVAVGTVRGNIRKSSSRTFCAEVRAQTEASITTKISREKVFSRIHPTRLLLRGSRENVVST
jgi:hypothetical protein